VKSCEVTIPLESEKNLRGSRAADTEQIAQDFYAGRFCEEYDAEAVDFVHCEIRGVGKSSVDLVTAQKDIEDNFARHGDIAVAARSGRTHSPEIATIFVQATLLPNRPPFAVFNYFRMFRISTLLNFSS
jgi:hypothetical protein